MLVARAAPRGRASCAARGAPSSRAPPSRRSARTRSSSTTASSTARSRATSTSSCSTPRTRSGTAGCSPPARTASRARRCAAPVSCGSRAWIRRTPRRSSPLRPLAREATGREPVESRHAAGRRRRRHARAASGVEALRGRRVLLLAGIARPGGFRRTLAALGAEVAAERVFPDHHRFSAARARRRAPRRRRRRAASSSSRPRRTRSGSRPTWRRDPARARRPHRGGDRPRSEESSTAPSTPRSAPRRRPPRLRVHRDPGLTPCASSAGSSSASPAAGSTPFGAALGALIWALRIRRRVVLDNLRLAFPEKTRGGAARHRAADLPQPRADDPRLRARPVPPAGGDRARCSCTRAGIASEEAIARGKGVIACTAHFGNFDLLAAAHTLKGVPVTMISRQDGEVRRERPLARDPAALRRRGSRRHEGLDARRGRPRDPVGPVPRLRHRPEPGAPARDLPDVLRRAGGDRADAGGARHAERRGGRLHAVGPARRRAPQGHLRGPARAARHRRPRRATSSPSCRT